MSRLDKKQAVIKEIEDKISGAQASILTDYKGLTVEKMTELRNSLRKADADYKVYKNTLSNLAYKNAGIDAIQYLTGPTAIAFSRNDPAVVAKILADFQKDNEIFGIKGGTLGSKIISKDDVKVLASLPSREVLLAKLLGGMNAPVSGFVNVLAGTIRSFVNVVQAIADQKEKTA